MFVEGKKESRGRGRPSNHSIFLVALQLQALLFSFDFVHQDSPDASSEATKTATIGRNDALGWAHSVLRADTMSITQFTLVNARFTWVMKLLLDIY